MSPPRLSLNVLDVAKPCRVPWQTMSGGDKVRFCTQCSKSVYDLSAMTAVEANELLGSAERPCVRFYRRADGTIATSEACVRVTRIWRRVTAVFGAMFVFLLSALGCEDRSKQTCTVGVPAPTGPMIQGEPVAHGTELPAKTKSTP
jgi:hypothetical protein